MTKIIGIVMIIISSLSVGYIFYINIKSRPKELDFFIKFLDEYKTQLKWQQKSLDEIVSSYGSSDYRDYIHRVNELLDSNDIYESFMKSNEFFENFHLNTDDKRILKAFFKQTGFSGLDGELNLVNSTIKALETTKQEAIAKFKKLGPFSIKIAVVCGVWVIILLF